MNHHSRRDSSHLQSVRITLCAMIIALSLVLMLTSSLLQVMVYVSPLFCGLLLIPVHLFFGVPTACLTYLATSILVVLLGMDKEMALFYVFIGYYPLIRWKMDRLGGKPVRFCLKLMFFALSVGCMYLILIFLLGLDSILLEFRESGVLMTILFFLGMLVCLMAYDRLLPILTLRYVTKLEPRLRKALRL